MQVQFHASADLPGDLRAVEAIARDGSGALVVADGDILTQREALAGLLADPRIATGMLTTTIRRVPATSASARARAAGGSWAPGRRTTTSASRTARSSASSRSRRRTASSSSPWRGGWLSSSTGRSLPGWREELDAKAGRWKLALHRRAQRALTDPDGEEQPSDEALAAADESGLLPEDVELDEAGRAELERRVAAAAGDVPSLLLCGLVRTDVKVGGTHLRRLFWARPLAPGTSRRRREDRRARRGQGAAGLRREGVRRLLHDVLRQPVLEVHRALGARRGLTPNQVTTISMLSGSSPPPGSRPASAGGMVAGAILLQAAFTLDCVDGQLARYTRTFTKLGAWLDSIFDRTKEYVVFAGPGDRRVAAATTSGCSPAPPRPCRCCATRSTSPSAAEHQAMARGAPAAARAA